MDDRTLFDEVFEQALGENPEVLMEKHAVAIARGDWERVRLLDECLRVPAILGTHAVEAARTRRQNN